MRTPVLIAALLLSLSALLGLTDPPPGAKPYSQGLDALQAADYRGAAARFAEALTADEDNADYVLARGVALTLAEDFAAAKPDLERARRLMNTDDWEPKLWLAASLFMANDPMAGSAIFSYGKRENYAYTESVDTMARTYMDSRYRGGYYDRVQHKQVKTNGPIKTGFPSAAKVFVERHRASSAAAPMTEEAAATAFKEGRFAEAMTLYAALLRDKPDDLVLLEKHALAAANAGNTLDARREFTTILTVDPFWPSAYAGRALAAAKQGDVVRAKADWQLALAYAQTSPQAPDQVGRALKADAPDRGGIEPLRTRLHEKALAGGSPIELTSIAAQLVSTFECYRLRETESYQDQLRALSAAVKDDPSAANLAELGAFLYKGVVNRRGESVEPRSGYTMFRPASAEQLDAELSRAEAALDAALSKDPDNLKALTFKAGVQMKRLQWQDAEATVKHALKLQPESPETLVMLSQVLDYAASVKAAKASGLRSPETWSDTYYIYTRRPSRSDLDRADEFERQAEALWALADERLRTAAKKAEGTALGAFYTGVIARREKDAAAVRAAFEKAVQLDPALVAARDQLVAIYSDAGLTMEAHRQQSLAANVTQSTAGPMLRMAWIEAARTARGSARKAANEACQMDPADPRGPAYLGVIEADAGNAAEAAAQFKVALALLEARARSRGESIAPDAKGPINDDDLGLALSIAERLARLGVDDATVVALEGRIDDAQLRRPLLSSLLPDPADEAEKLPTAHSPAFYLAAERAALGRAALAKGQLDEAEKQFQAAIQLQAAWPMTLQGRESLNAPACAGRLGLVKVAMARGKMMDARKLMTRDGWPGELPKTLTDEIAQTRKDLDSRRGK